MPSEAQSTIDDDDYFGLMDIVVVIAEWWIYILSAAIIAGGVAFWFISAREPTFSAVAILDVSNVSEELILSPAIIDRIVSKTSVGSREEFRRIYSINNSNPEIAQIEISGDAPARTIEIMNAVIDELELIGEPSDSRRNLIERRILRLTQAVEQSQQTRNRMLESQNEDATLFNTGQRALAIVSLSADIDARLDQLQTEERRLVGFSRDQIIRSPTAVEVPPTGGLRILVIAVAGSVFFVIAIGIARELWLRARRDPINRPKTDRIREAFFRS